MTPIDANRPASNDQRPRPLDQVDAFRYVTAENASNYRALLEVFVEAKAHYVIELRPPEILERLGRSGLQAIPFDPAELDRHLDQLADWGNLQRAHDTAAVGRVEDFYRRRYLYRLTAVGEAAHRAVGEVEATVGRSGSLQVSMLLEVRGSLEALAAAARAGDAPGMVRALHRLRGAFESLTQEANLFLGDLDRHAGAERVEEDRFLAHKQALLVYLGRFLEDLRRLRSELAERVAEVDGLVPARFLAQAVTAAELPPATDGADLASRWQAEERERWAGLHAWFAGDAAGPPRVDRLHAVAVEAVVRLTRSLARLNERRVRAVDRAADFRTLARWFSGCATGEEAHALWASAFGLYAARHFHLVEEDPERTRPGTSWWEAAPVDVPIRLRTRGAVVRSGRPPPAEDFSDGRAWMAALRRRERAQVEAAMTRFAGRGPVLLSSLAELDVAEFEQLLALLDEALAAPRAEDGSRKALTVDGALEVVLVPPAGERRWVSLRTPSGLLRCLDYELRVTGMVAHAEATTGGTP